MLPLIAPALSWLGAVGAPAAAAAAGAATGALGEQWDDATGTIKNPYNEPDPWKANYGMANQDVANFWNHRAIGERDRNAANADMFMGRMGNAAQGTQVGAYENAFQSNRENQARGNQLEALGMMRSAALGEAPSVAQNQLFAGLNQANAQQAASAAGARGAGALANAQTNAAANVAAAGQQTNQQAAMLRAQEMAEARGAFGGMTNNLRGADQARLQMGNQMSQFNAGQANDMSKFNAGQRNTNAYNMGMLGNQANAQALQGLKAGMEFQGEMARTNAALQSEENKAFQSRQDRVADVEEANVEARRNQRRENWNTLTSLGQTAGKVYGGSKGGG